MEINIILESSPNELFKSLLFSMCYFNSVFASSSTARNTGMKSQLLQGHRNLIGLTGLFFNDLQSITTPISSID